MKPYYKMPGFWSVSGWIFGLNHFIYLQNVPLSKEVRTSVSHNVWNGVKFVVFDKPRHFENIWRLKLGINKNYIWKVGQWAEYALCSKEPRLKVVMIRRERKSRDKRLNEKNQRRVKYEEIWWYLSE
jgi:hypothetical protein